MTDAVEFTTMKGNLGLEYAGYRFNYKCDNYDTVIWTCQKRTSAKCKCLLETKQKLDGRHAVVLLRGDHTCHGTSSGGEET